jgi:hypothetical protein
LKITKIRVPEQVKMLAEGASSKLLQPTRDEVVEATQQTAISRLGKRELAPYSKFLNKRDEHLLLQSASSSTELSLIPETTLVQSSFDDKIIDFEVLQHYMTVLQEKNNIR